MFVFFWADTSVRPYGGVLEVLEVSKDFRVFKVSLAEIVYISRVIVGADRRVCPLLFFVRVFLWADTSVRPYGDERRSRGGGILCVCVFWADTSVRPYGGVLEVLEVSKDFRVFKVSLAEIVYISRVIVGADRCVCPLLFAFFFGRTHRSAPTTGEE